MKYIVFLIATLIVNVSNAQLAFIGDDDKQKGTFDGYLANKRTVGFVSLNGKYYFATPNGNIFETDGTENNAKIIQQFEPQNVPYFNATNKYLYFAHEAKAGEVKELVRYSPTTGISYLKMPSQYNRNFTVNGNPVPGRKQSVTGVFTNYDKDALLVRHYTNDIFYIFKFDDNTEKKEAVLVATYPLDFKNVNTPIDVNTSIETFNNEVYFNGRTKPTGSYETSIRVFKPSEADKGKYEIKTLFELYKQNGFPYFGFFRTKNNIYSLLKVKDSATNKFQYSLFFYKNKNIENSKTFLPFNADDYAVEKTGENIHISYKGFLYEFDELKSSYNNIINEPDASLSWDEIAKEKRFLKVGDYYMYRRGGKLWVFNYKNKSTKEVTNEALAKNYNFFTYHNIYAYSGDNCFYFTQYINEKETFIKYNPATNSYTPIVFPSFKKQNFEDLKAIYQENGKFIFLTSYKGKKDKIIYKMFMYTEDGDVLITSSPTPTNEITNAPIKQIEKQAQDNFDLKNFNKKLFKEQLSNILQNQTNHFGDIKGANISDIDYKCAIQLEGFKEGKIRDFSSVSKLIRYEAVTLTIKGKANALAVLDMLDKEVQNLIAGKSITKEIDIDVKTRKIYNYIIKEKVNYDASEIKYLQLDAYSNGFDKEEDAFFTITIRADKQVGKIKPEFYDINK